MSLKIFKVCDGCGETVQVIIVETPEQMAEIPRHPTFLCGSCKAAMMSIRLSSSPQPQARVPLLSYLDADYLSATARLMA